MSWAEIGIFFGGFAFALGCVLMVSTVAAMNKERILRWYMRRAVMRSRKK